MAEEKWRIAIDSNACHGTGMCEALAPKHFTLLHGASQATEGEIAPDDDVVQAAESCPHEAIQLSAADGRTIAPDWLVG